MNRLDIYSDTGTYALLLNVSDEELKQTIDDAKAVVIDKVVLELYREHLGIEEHKLITLEALEEKKTPEAALDICEQLIRKEVRRKDMIVAIGGGITQDLVTFATSILFRGVKWIWLPTTLLAQADSCIGGKSSLNFKRWKNILGNFYPPHKIYVQEAFLQTLQDDDIRSGIGEILKVHLLSGKAASDQVLEEMHALNDDPSVLSKMIFDSLRYKNEILKVDALDTGERLKMNYGHSFGHALESATDFGIPHGIAVTIGLDMANYVGLQQGTITQEHFLRLHDALQKNLRATDFVAFDFDDFIAALRKDKKNDAETYRLVIPVADGAVELLPFAMDAQSDTLFKSYFDAYYEAVRT